MKLNSILGCALVTGLMAFAADNAHAKNLVVDNVLYAPFNLKLETQYPDDNKFKKATLTTKQYLQDLGYNSNVTLMVNTDTREVWVVNGETLVSNLTSNETLAIGFSFVVQVQPKESKQAYEQVGTFSVSSGSANNFYVAGKYFRKYSRTDSKNGEFTYSDDVKCDALEGTGNFADLYEGILPITGSADYKGSGKIQDLE